MHQVAVNLQKQPRRYSQPIVAPEIGPSSTTEPRIMQWIRLETYWRERAAEETGKRLDLEMRLLAMSYFAALNARRYR